jgi:transcriptional regulator GlxA family with amidase domain
VRANAGHVAKRGERDIAVIGSAVDHVVMPLRTVLAVLYPDMRALDVTGPLEVFVAANRQLSDRAGYRVRTASGGGRQVRAGGGLTLLPDGDLWAAPAPHTLLVPGAAGQVADPEVVAWLWQSGSRTRRIMSVCTGAFLLAEAGLLAGRRATTHWASAATLADLFPDVRVDPSPLFVRDGPVATSAGVTAGIDLALALVEEDHGRDVALATARQLTTYLRRPGDQAQFRAGPASARPETRCGPAVRAAREFVAGHVGERLSVAGIARHANLSARQLTRLFLAELGVTPGRYVEQVRLEAARRMLEDTSAGVEEISRACGFGAPETMRRSFLRGLGVSPAEYRRRF